MLAATLLCLSVSTLPLSVAGVQAKAPGLQALMQAMHSRGHQLMAHLDGARSWGPPGRMPAGGQYCYESPQVAR